MHTTKLKLGTRKSLLAIAQSSWVAREIERLNPGTQIELVGIETKGDIVLDKPLSQIEGKEFFTAELDHALLRGEVDLTVHSMKDLSIDRPEAIQLAAVPARELQHDVILFHDSVLGRIREGKPVRIGTSSPRRLTLIPSFLKQALPRYSESQEPLIQFVEIRGNVNTRLSRVHEPEGSDRKLDGVVLAFAGLERLALDGKASVELGALLKGTRMMVLPLKACPSAPAQGALAIEALKSATGTLAKISKMHDESTLRAVSKEREVLSEWGGGCHQKLGASCLPSGVLFIQGQKPSGEWVNETRGAKKPEATHFIKIEAGDVFDFEPSKLNDSDAHALRSASLVFIAHSRSFELLEEKELIHNDSQKRVWVSGTQSWFKLARKGLWIEGSLDGQGIDSMKSYQNKNLLGFKGRNFLVLTHCESPISGNLQQVGSYRHQFRTIPKSFLNENAIYWSSGLPFLALWEKLGPEAFIGKKHACGPGKTAQLIKEKLAPLGIEPVILSME
jgi:hydroxymethylbilane synthase